jgi:hypothetical protein
VGQNIITAGFNFFYIAVDRGLLEKIGPTGIIDGIYFLVKRNVSRHNGQVLAYLKKFVYSGLIIFMVNAFICFYIVCIKHGD